MATWIVDNLGYPEPGRSLDRINNDGHYEAGNLRWATRTEQANNKRAYKGAVYEFRIKALLEETDYGYESLRTFINQGMTDDEIRNRPRRSGGRPRLRHR